MKIFVINLARRPDRLAHMRSQLADFERIDAVDGAACPDAAVSRFRFWCSKGYGIKPGEIGAALSHRKAYRLMVERGLVVACILEDDVALAADFTARIEALAPQLMTEEPIVLSFAETAAGYLVNRAAAQLLLSVNMPIRSTADDWKRWRRKGLRWEKVEGLLTCSPYGDPNAVGIARSDIIGDARHFVANMPPARKFVYKFIRIFGKTLDCVLK